MQVDKVIEIFLQVDDFILENKDKIERLRLESGKKRIRNRKSKLSDSEMMTIYICFHLSHYNNFKAYYNEYVRVYWRELFPGLVSYERFNQTQKKIVIPLMLFLNHCCLGKSRGINFIDSTSLKVCHVKREKQHRVFKGIATKTKGTMGWYFGFKLHLVINDKGEVLSFCLTKSTVDDRNLGVMKCLTENIFGKLFGDRGYISKTLADYLWNDGVSLIYKRRRNMKEQNLSDTDKILLRKRSLIESVNDELKNICSIEHTRHRSLQGFLNNMVTAICAYQFLPKKPSLKIKKEHRNQSQLLIAA